MKRSKSERRQTKDSTLEKARQLFENHQDELVTSIGDAFKSLAWENRYTLHPRRLREMPAEEVESFTQYLQSFDDDSVTAHGGARADEGLSHNALLKLFGLYRHFFLDSAANGGLETPNAVLEILDGYLSAYLRGFIEKRERRILSDQEQLRIALSNTLERQRKELHIKNYAIHTSINGIVIAGTDGLISYANPAFLKLWELSGDDKIVGTSMIQLWGTEKAKQIDDSLARDGWWQGEVTCSRQDGSLFDATVSASLIMDETIIPIGIMASLIDVTLRHRLESQFRQSQKMEALGQLAGGIVHDFNNLLTAISGYAQLELLDLPSDSPQYNDFLQIKAATDRGRDLTRQLRVFTRQESTGMEPLNLNNVIEETYNIMKRVFRPEVHVELVLSQELHSTRANASQIIQLIMNLCVNADDAIQSLRPDEQPGLSAGVGGTITITTANVELDERAAGKFLDSRPGGYVCLIVRDTGTGMEPATIERLFEPFFTTKGKMNGTGLGLAVVYGIVHNHSGFIDVESEPGSGSSFKIYLPVAEETNEQPDPVRFSPKLVIGNGTVLLVDDDDQVRQMLSRALEKSRYAVISASNGFEAVQKYQSHRDQIDLVILDMVMPRMNGRDCLHRLKEINPDVKVVIMTGYTTDASAVELFGEGALRVVPKPFDLQSFTDDIKSIIGGEVPR